MAEYIERGIAIAKLTALEVTNSNATIADAKRLLADMSITDVAPVHHSHWEEADWREYDAQSGEIIRFPKAAIVCTICRCAFKKDALWSRNYCPSCGVKMIEVE